VRNEIAYNGVNYKSNGVLIIGTDSRSNSLSKNKIYNTAYVKSNIDKRGKFSKIWVTRPHQGESSHAKYINRRTFVGHLCNR
jgi:hypothetical protein